MPDRDHEVRSDEHVDLAELDRLRLVDVASRPQDQEQDVAVPLELGPLVGVNRVLDCQFVELELTSDRGQLFLRGLVEPKPRHSLALPGRGGELREARGLGNALAVLVHGGVDDHAGTLPPVASRSCRTSSSVRSRHCPAGRSPSSSPAYRGRCRRSDRQPDRGAHPLDLVLAPLVERELEPVRARAASHAPARCGRRRARRPRGASGVARRSGRPRPRPRRSSRRRTEGARGGAPAARRSSAGARRSCRRRGDRPGRRARRD